MGPVRQNPIQVSNKTDLMEIGLKLATHKCGMWEGRDNVAYSKTCFLMPMKFQLTVANKQR